MLRITAKSPKDKEILEKLAKSVLPVMKRRSWSVGHFTELDPHQHAPNLLGYNVNRGEVIKVRLKYKSGAYIEWHNLIGTTLHELTHNKYGSHDDKFYKLLDEIYDEWERDDQGVVMPFSGQGQQLGGKLRTPLEAALQRKQSQPQRLGGAQVKGDPRQMAVLAALERRNKHDDHWCAGIGGGALVIDLTQSSDDELYDEW